jgi:hypothetical protein
MDQTRKQGEGELRDMMRSVMEEFLTGERQRAEPAYKAELIEERRRRESLERRVNELAEENQRSRRRAQEVEQHAQVKAELQRLGVGKVDLAFKALKSDLVSLEDGSLVARTPEGEVGLKEHLVAFVRDNPEFLPARIQGGSGVTSPPRQTGGGGYGVELERIRPGMSAEELQRVRDQISQVALQSLRGE